MTGVLLRHARIAPQGPLQDVLVAGGRIARVGEVDDHTGVVEVLDVEGRYVLPGLWDRHVHFEQWAQVRARLPLADAESASAAARLVAMHIGTRPRATDGPVVGYGFRDALWPDAPGRETLDAQSGEVPVVLISADLHSVWLNTAALRRYGYANDATGLLREDAAMSVIAAVGNVAESVTDACCVDATRAAAARGLVGIVDMERPWSLDTWRRRIAGGNRRLRVISAVWPEHLDDAIARRLHTGDIVDGTDGLLSVGPLKVITDGSLNTRTAFCHDPYHAVTGAAAEERGVLLVDLDELSRLMVRANDSGFDCAVHAIGDAANSMVIQAFARTGARGSVEHAQLLDDSDVPRFAQLALIASVQPEHALDDRDVADHYWAGRTARAFPLRSLLDAGAVLTLGSDAPVAPLDPWVAIAAAVHRSRDERPRWHPEQEITTADALAASMPPGRGSLTLGEGDIADLMVLDGDPFTADARALRTMPVVATMVSGNWTHRVGV